MRALLDFESHATLQIDVRRSVDGSQHEHISRAFPCLCSFVFPCTPVHSNSLAISTDSLVCLRRRLDQTAFGFALCPEHVSRTCLTLSSSTRVFHKVSWTSFIHGHPLRLQCVWREEEGVRRVAVALTHTQTQRHRHTDTTRTQTETN